MPCSALILVFVSAENIPCQKYIKFGTTGTGIAGYSSGIYFEGNSTGATIFIRPKLNQASIKALVDGAVVLHYSGNQKLTTTTDGVTVSGSVTSSSYGSLGNYSGLFGKIRIGADVYGNTIKTAGDANFNITANNSIAFNLGANANGSDSGASVAVILSTGIRPTTNGQKDLGEASYRWRNIYTNDLNLSNEGSKNDVDGTWGDFTIQEGESDLFLINKRSGKKYKFNLTEVS